MIGNKNMKCPPLLQAAWMCLCFFLCVTCGSVSQQIADGVTPNSDISGATDSAIFVFATDFISSGQLYRASLSDEETSLTNSGVTLLGSSATIKVFDEVIYVLHDGFSAVSSDNVQVIDPNNDFATTAQYSTGNGTNPHDLIVIDHRAFISLYNPSADSGDVIEMDLDSGEILYRYSFHDFLTDDGDLNANADQMVLVDDVLLICLQDLESSTFEATTTGKVGMIDTTEHRVLGAFDLEGRNPVDIVASDDGTRVFVADMATYDFTLGEFNTTSAYGGIEVVDLATQSTQVFIDDTDLGGYVERLKTSSDTVYAVVSHFDDATFTYASRIARLTQDIATNDDLTIFEDFTTDIRDIQIDGDYIWISRRVSGANDDTSSPRIDVLDIASGIQIGNSLVPAAAGTSLAL
jgi:hypothetical protein